MPVNQPRRHGSYVPLSAHYYKDDAIAAAGEKAELLYIRGLAFCADVLSDGIITDSQLLRFVGVGMKDARTRAEALCKVGLWEQISTEGLWEEGGQGGGYRVLNWTKWNRTKKEIDAKLQEDAERKAAAIARRRALADAEAS